MPQHKDVSIQALHLDLSNYRTLKQSDEPHALHAMITVNPDRFWALTESLIEDGFLPIENIIVLESDDGALIIREGNRRVAALKLTHGILTFPGLAIPPAVEAKIAAVTPEWKAATQEVPCVIYPPAEAAIVERIVALAHGLGEQAGRDPWTAVARARHARNANGESQPALDLLEAYLNEGKNLTPNQSELWSATYPLSVLDEAMGKLASRFGASNGPDLAGKYPNLQHLIALEEIMRDIGLRSIGFKELRDPNLDLAGRYGVPSLSAPGSPPASPGPVSPPVTPPSGLPPGAPGGPPPAPPTPPGPAPAPPAPPKPGAVPINDPRSVKKALRNFKVLGQNRDKVESLRKEAVRLDVVKTPFAFCFVLRSMLEISAKAYCVDHAAAGGPSATKANGDDRKLVEVLKDVTQHLINTSSDKGIQKRLHGAGTELAKPEGLLSVTSLNQLIHNPTFSVSPTDISSVFNNVFPLLLAMNS